MEISEEDRITLLHAISNLAKAVRNFDEIVSKILGEEEGGENATKNP